MITSIKISEGPGTIWRSNPGPPALRLLVGEPLSIAFMPASPRCCPAPEWRARGRWAMGFESSIAGAAAGACGYAARVIEGRCTARPAAPGSAGTDACGQRGAATNGAAVARTYTRRGNGATGRGAPCGGARAQK